MLWRIILGNRNNFENLFLFINFKKPQIWKYIWVYSYFFFLMEFEGEESYWNFILKCYFFNYIYYLIINIYYYFILLGFIGKQIKIKNICLFWRS